MLILALQGKVTLGEFDYEIKTSRHHLINKNIKL